MYDLGLRVPLAIAGPGIEIGTRSLALASEVDLLPTLMNLIQDESGEPLVIPGKSESDSDNNLPYKIHGKSLGPVLKGQPGAAGHEYIFAEISNLGPLPNDGIQERSVFDGRWKLIYRENVEQKWRQVNADSRLFEKWGNRTYAETIRVKERFPAAYRILTEMDPQQLAGSVPSIELYDLKHDPDETKNLAEVAGNENKRARLMNALRKWAIETDDTSLQLIAKN